MFFTITFSHPLLERYKIFPTFWCWSVIIFWTKLCFFLLLSYKQIKKIKAYQTVSIGVRQISLVGDRGSDKIRREQGGVWFSFIFSNPLLLSFKKDWSCPIWINFSRKNGWKGTRVFYSRVEKKREKRTAYSHGKRL